MKILNYGSLNIDYVYSVEHFVRSGETISSRNMEIFPGGKGLNQSVALARSGVEIWHAGAVGEDGAFLLELMREAGVNTELISCLPGRTGHAIIQKEPSGQNCILLFGGTNRQNTKERVDAVLSGFEKDDFLLLQNEINELPYIIEKAHETGMRIMLNPSPMDKEIFCCPLEYVDYFLLNEVEAGDLCGHPGDDEELLSELAKMFPHSRLVLTLGDRGAIYRDKEQILHQPICKVTVADTTAAGDTFTGYFIGDIVRGKTPSEAMEDAAKASAITVSRAGAAVSIPFRDELKQI